MNSEDAPFAWLSPAPARAIAQAGADLRAARAVVLCDQGRRMLVAGVECLSERALADMRSAAKGEPRLLLTRHRLDYLDSGRDGADASLAVLPSDTQADLVAWSTSREPAWPAGRAMRSATGAERAALALARRAEVIPALLLIEPNAAASERIDALVAAGALACLDADRLTTFLAQDDVGLRQVGEADVPLEAAPNSRFVVFREVDGDREHIAIAIGDPAAWADPVPVRLHSACLTGDLFGSLRCDCGPQLRAAIRTIEARGGGVLLYLAQEGRGIGLANKMHAYRMQDQGLDTVEADQVLGFDHDGRTYAVARDMLAALHVSRIDLLTNNPAKIDALDRGRLQVAARSSLYGSVTDQNRRYLATKATRANHWLAALLDTPADEDDR